MSWTDDPFGAGHIAGNDLQNMENNFLAAKSLFAGSGSPVNPVPYQLWGDTGRNILRIRNDAGNGWLAVFSGDKAQKKWVYRNDTCEGWVIDTAVTDCVLAVKGGANAYNVSGGAVAGTWTWPDHALTLDELPAHTHAINSQSYHTHGTNLYSGFPYEVFFLTNGGGGSHNHTIGDTGGDQPHNHGGDTLRPAAAVGTLQYPDLP